MLRASSVSLQVQEDGSFLLPAKEELRVFSGTFQREHCVRIPQFLSPALLRTLQGQIEQLGATKKVYKQIGEEMCFEDSRTVGLFMFLMNDPALFRVAEEITGSSPVQNFSGRLYQLIPAEGHLEGWHNDTGKHRMFGFSINLSREPYEGGVLQIRDQVSKKVLSEVANTVPGDAVLFQISHGLEHRVTRVVGSFARTAFAGWFRSEPSFLSFLKGGQFTSRP